MIQKPRSVTPPQRSQEDRLLRPHEAADVLACSTRTVWRLRASLRLPAVKVANSTRFRQSDVQRLVTEGVTL